MLAVVLSACDDDERRGIRLTPTSTIEPGVRALVDNCPGPTTVALSIRDDVLWQIDSLVPALPEPVEEDGDPAIDPGAAPTPGIAEFVIGQTPPDWAATVPLTEPLTGGIRYTVHTLPDGQTIDFSLPDLDGGLLWDGFGNSRFNPDLISVECSEPADVGAFTQSVLILGILGAVSIALVLVSIIALLFVITRRFSRVRSLQKKAQRQASGQDQRPRTRAKS